MSVLKHLLYRYPIKGLSAQPLSRVELQAKKPFPHDRIFALVRPGAPFDTDNPKWGKKGLFVMLMLEEALARVKTVLDVDTLKLTITQGNRELITASLENEADRAKVEELDRLNVDGPLPVDLDTRTYPASVGSLKGAKAAVPAFSPGEAQIGKGGGLTLIAKWDWSSFAFLPKSQLACVSGTRRLDIGSEGGLLGAAIGTSPVFRNVREGCTGRDRLLGKSGGWVVDKVAAAADERLTGRWADVDRRPRDNVCLHRSWRYDGIAHADAAAFARRQVDAELLMSESRAQRARNIEIAPSGLRIDVGCTATAVTPVDAKQRAADPDVAAVSQSNSSQGPAPSI